jgi:hypothetical protein
VGCKVAGISVEIRRRFGGTECFFLHGRRVRHASSQQEIRGNQKRLSPTSDVLTSCSSVRNRRRFGRTYCLHPQGRRVSAFTWRHIIAGYLLSLPFYAEDGS